MAFSVHKMIGLFSLSLSLPLIAAPKPSSSRSTTTSKPSTSSNSNKIKSDTSTSHSDYTSNTYPKSKSSSDPYKNLKAASERKKLVSSFSSGAEFKRSRGLAPTSTRSEAGMFSLFHPAGILNPFNPWNSMNPFSPWYPSRHQVSRTSVDSVTGVATLPTGALRPEIKLTNDKDNCIVKNDKDEVVLRFDKMSPLLVLVSFPKKDKDFSISNSAIKGEAYSKVYYEKKLRVEVDMDHNWISDPSGTIRVKNYETGNYVSTLKMKGRICKYFEYKNEDYRKIAWTPFASAVVVATNNASWEDFLSYLPPKPTNEDLERADSKAVDSLRDAVKQDQAEDEAELAREKAAAEKEEREALEENAKQPTEAPAEAENQ